MYGLAGGMEGWGWEPADLSLFLFFREVAARFNITWQQRGVRGLTPWLLWPGLGLSHLFSLKDVGLLSDGSISVQPVSHIPFAGSQWILCANEGKVLLPSGPAQPDTGAGLGKQAAPTSLAEALPKFHSHQREESGEHLAELAPGQVL